MPAVQETVARVREIDVDKYKYGFTTDIESIKAPKGLSEDIVRFISARKREPEWLLEWRLEAYRRWRTLDEPKWAGVHCARVDGPRVAVDAVFDSISVVTTFKEELAKAGVIFCSISEAVREHPELVRKYLGSVVPQSDNFYAALNSAVFSDGSFVYVPPGVRCPMELSTYFRINEKQ